MAAYIAGVAPNTTVLGRKWILLTIVATVLYAHDLRMLIILEVVSPLPHTKESDSLLKVQFA